jgi:hypothetical protein
MSTIEVGELETEVPDVASMYCQYPQSAYILQICFQNLLNMTCPSLNDMI